jgi:hypothetical protein
VCTATSARALDFLLAEYFKTVAGQIKTGETKANFWCFTEVSFYFPPDQALQRKAAEKLRKLLREQSFMERWEPVGQELKWVISGRSDAKSRQKILPEYCYNIFDLYTRTILKSISPMRDGVQVRAHADARTQSALLTNSLTVERFPPF